ncbi:MipA/OmpV family protein [Serratia sp. D1N4]
MGSPHFFVFPTLTRQSLGLYTLLGDAADSPIVEKKVAGIAFMSASYRF